MATPVSALVTIEISPPTNKPPPPPSGIRLNATTQYQSSQSTHDTTDCCRLGGSALKSPNSKSFDQLIVASPLTGRALMLFGFLKTLPSSSKVGSHSRPRSSPCTAEITSGFISRFAYPRLRILCKVVLIYQTFLKLLSPLFLSSPPTVGIISAPNELLASAFTMVS